MRVIVIASTCLACLFALVYLAHDGSTASISPRRLQLVLDKPTMAFALPLPRFFALSRERPAPNPTVTFADIREGRKTGIDHAAYLKAQESMRQESRHDRRVETPSSFQWTLPMMQQAPVMDRPKVASSEEEKHIEDFRSKLERLFEPPSPPPPPPGRGGRGGDGDNGGGGEDVMMKQLSEFEAKQLVDEWIHARIWTRETLQGLETVRSFAEDLPRPRGTLTMQLALPVSDYAERIIVGLYASQRRGFGGDKNCVVALAAGFEPGLVGSSDVLDIKHVLVSPFEQRPNDLSVSRKLRAGLRAVTQQLGLNLQLPDEDGV